MMNKTQEIYYELFQEVQNKRYDLNSNIHRKYICKNNMGIIYSVSVGKGMRALEIPIEESRTITKFPAWKGVKIDLVRMPEYSKTDQIYIELQQMPGTEAYIFEIIVEDLRRAIESMKPHIGCEKCTIEKLKKWKEFFSAGRGPVLSEKERQGLYGELLFLKELINNLGGLSVNFWAGANNETHDFYIGQNAVEIKTTSMQAPYMAHINSEYQLDNNDVNGKLYLRMYAFRKDTNGGQKLPELIAMIRDMLKTSSSIEKIFEDKLAKAGYLDAAEEYYQEGYTIREVYSFAVSDGFPRIGKKIVPQGIYSIEYKVSIAQCMRFAMESKDLMEEIMR